MKLQGIHMGAGVVGAQLRQRGDKLPPCLGGVPARKFLCLTAALLMVFVWSRVRDVSAQEASFGPSIRVDDDTTGRNQLSPSLAVDPQGNVYVAWHDVRNIGITGRRDIYFGKSTDGGNTWSSNVKVNDDDPPNPDWPSLDVDADGNIYVTWEDDRNGVNIYFAMSTDGGETWTHPNIQVNEDAPGMQFSPDLAVNDSGYIYVVWDDQRNDLSDIYFAMSTDKGATWTTPNVGVNSPSSGLQLGPSVAVDDSGTICVVWEDNRDGTPRIYFASSTDSGFTWSPNVPVSDTASLGPGYPSMDVDGEGTIYVAWEDQRDGDLDIYFAKSTDGGSTWTDPNIRVNDDAPRHQYVPSLAVDEGGNVYVAWTDYRRGIDDCDVYFALSTDGGNSWTDPNIRVNDTLTVFAQFPSLDVQDSGDIYVAFNSLKDTIWSDDIYFAKGTVTGVEETSDARYQMPDARLLQNRPNPCREFTIISYQLPKPLHISLRIYNMAGRLVRNLGNGEREAGAHTIWWGGKDDRGRKVSSGIYFCCLEAGDLRASRKLLLLR